MNMIHVLTLMIVKLRENAVKDQLQFAGVESQSSEVSDGGIEDDIMEEFVHIS